MSLAEKVALMNLTEKRVAALRARLEEQELAGLLVTNLTNVAYLSGFTGSAGALVVTADQTLLIADFRYFTQVEQQAPDWTLVKADPGEKLEDRIAETVARLDAGRFGFEAQSVSVALHGKLTAKVPPEKWVPTRDLVEGLRKVKDDTEIAAIRRAADLADRALAHVLEYVAPGVTERELAAELEYFMKRTGADHPAFPSIVAAGPNSALPHAGITDRPVQRGDLLLFDLGARRGGFCSDLTRTVCVGEAEAWQRDIYALTYQAQRIGLEGVRSGVAGIEVDRRVRDFLKQAGHEEHYGHGLGHGVGRDIHEGPRLSPTSEETLEPGMVVTVEPGLYLPQRGGVRLEDLVVVTADGCEVLSHSPKPEDLPEV